MVDLSDHRDMELLARLPDAKHHVASGQTAHLAAVSQTLEFDRGHVAEQGQDRQVTRQIEGSDVHRSLLKVSRRFDCPSRLVHPT